MRKTTVAARRKVRMTAICYFPATMEYVIHHLVFDYQPKLAEVTAQVFGLYGKGDQPDLVCILTGHATVHAGWVPFVEGK